MSWAELSPDLRALAASRLTRRELDLLKARAANPALGHRTLGMMLGLSPTRIRDLERQIRRKLADLAEDERL